MDKSISVLISQEEIKSRIKFLGEQIKKDYIDSDYINENNPLTILCVLRGAFIFCADLIRSIDLPINVEFISLSSYKEGMQSQGKIDLEFSTDLHVENKHVLIVEDIVDTGLTIEFLINHLRFKKASSVKLATFLHKSSKTVHHVDIDYCAFEIQDKFVIGYGLDYAQKYRELPYVGVFQEG